jgi:hypothetical protein
LVQTQIQEISTSEYYNIDAYQFDSDFITQRGGISRTPGKSMISDNYMTYADNTAYTLYFTLSNYIPLAGVVTVLVPKELKITSDPYAALTKAEGSNF